MFGHNPRLEAKVAAMSPAEQQDFFNFAFKVFLPAAAAFIFYTPMAWMLTNLASKLQDNYYLAEGLTTSGLLSAGTAGGLLVYAFRNCRQEVTNGDPPPPKPALLEISPSSSDIKL